MGKGSGVQTFHRGVEDMNLKYQSHKLNYAWTLGEKKSNKRLQGPGRSELEKNVQHYLFIMWHGRDCSIFD